MRSRRGATSEQLHQYGRHRGDLQRLGWDVHVCTLDQLLRRREEEDRPKIIGNLLEHAENIVRECDLGHRYTGEFALFYTSLLLDRAARLSDGQSFNCAAHVIDVDEFYGWLDFGECLKARGLNAR